METQRLWELVTQNAKHIQIMNRELGEIVAQIEYIREILNWQFGLLAMVLCGIILNIVVTKKNGKKK